MKQLLYVLNAKLRNISPFSIGSGAGDNSDKDILIDKSGTPFIPATSFIGVVRSYLLSQDGFNKSLISKYFGTEDNKNPMQSLITCNDLHAASKESNKVIIRDGIKIDSERGIVEDKKKYDYEIADSGIDFNLEMTFRAELKGKDEIEKILSAIISGFAQNQIRLGAKTNAGFGKMLIKDITTTFFDFTKKKDAACFLLGKQGNKIDLLSGLQIELPNDTFNLQANFLLKTSLIIKSYPTDPALPDAVHIKSNDKFVLPGTSLKGAIRARAEKILNTIHGNEIQEKFINDLFGFVIEGNSEEGNVAKGRLRVDETILPAFTEYLQNRIKIDRFTGGVIESALFDSVPLFPGENINLNDKIININININKCKPEEAGLLLLVLKDLWTGDLAVGGEKNVGRGVLNGINANIKYDGHEINLSNDFSNLSSDVKTVLEGYVLSLHERSK